MNATAAIFQRELVSLLARPLLYVVLAAFLLGVNLFAFNEKGIFDAGQADLTPFFEALPWMCAGLAPVVSMRSYAEYARPGALDALLSLPASSAAIALGKFFAAWAYVCLGLALTTPIWLAVTILGAPDHGVIALGYGGAVLLAGALVSLGCAAGAFLSGQAAALVVAALGGLGFLALGLPLTTQALAGWIGPDLAAGVSGLSPLGPMQGFSRGVLDAAGFVHFAALIGLGLAWAGLALSARRGR
jgi:ABC-2 type transport system permease protein